MEHLVVQLGRHGLVLVLGNILIERTGAPLPALPLIFVAGALAARGQISLVALLAVSLLSAVAADLVWYAGGRWQGLRLLRAVCGISLSPESCVRQTAALFERRGTRSLLYAKFIPGYSIVSVPLAGAARATVGDFLLWDGLGNLLWAASGALTGFLFHNAVGRGLHWMSTLGLWAGILAGGGLAFLAAGMWWQRRRFYKLLRLARISTAELKRLIDRGEAPVVVDVRTRASYQTRHIPGALRITFDEIDNRLASLPREGEIVVYCTCPDEVSAARVARALMDRGFTRVRPLEGGLNAWVTAGHQTDEETMVSLPPAQLLSPEPGL